MDLCLICCSKDSHKTEIQNRLSTNLNVIFLFKNLLQVPNNQLETNLKEFGNPENWIRLCDQCNKLAKQAEQLYCKIVKTEIELRTVRKLIIEKAKSSTIELISDYVDESNLCVKNGNREEYEKRKAIWKVTRSFTKTFDYRKFTNTANPFTEKDKLAAHVVNQQGRNNRNGILDEDSNFNDDDFDMKSESTDEPKVKYNVGNDDKPPEKHKLSKKCSPIKRPTVDGKFKCNFCDKLFEKRGTCNSHEAQKHVSNPGQFVCHICGKACNSNKSLVSHRWGVHRVKVDGTTLPALPKPKYPSRPRRTDRVYKRMVNIDGKWKCRHCDRVFDTKVGCYSHEATKHRIIPGHFICDICGKTWNSNNDLVKHKWGIHKVRVDGTPIPIKPKTLEEPQPCNLCGKTFSSRKGFKNHVRYAHNKEKELKSK